MNADKRHIIDELDKRPSALPEDDYFAQLKSAVLGKLDPEPGAAVETVSSPGRRQTRAIRPWQVLVAAASVVLIVTLFALNGNDRPDPAAQAKAPDWNSVSQDELVAYIHENIDDFETEAIAVRLDSIPRWDAANVGRETAAARPAGSVDAGDDTFDELFRDIEKEDILEYLEDEAIELEDELLF